MPASMLAYSILGKTVPSFQMTAMKRERGLRSPASKEKRRRCAHGAESRGVPRKHTWSHLGGCGQDALVPRTVQGFHFHRCPGKEICHHPQQTARKEVRRRRRMYRRGLVWILKSWWQDNDLSPFLRPKPGGSPCLCLTSQNRVHKNPPG